MRAFMSPFVVALMATPLAAQTAPAELAACISAMGAPGCLQSSYEMCDSGAFGEGGGSRGWCKGQVRDLWTNAVTAAVAHSSACLSDAAEQAALSAAQTAWTAYRDQHCDLAALRDRDGIGGGEDARTGCLASMAASRIHELPACR